MSDQAAPAPAPARRGSANLVGWLTTVVFNVVAPIVIYGQLKDHGCSEFTAILLSGLGPVIDIAIYLAWHRRVDEFAILSLVFVALSLVISLIGPHDAKLLLAKDSFVTGLLGVVYLATLAMPRPLMFYFGRKFATDGTPQMIEWWNGMWQYEGFRRVQRNLTIGWGVAFIAEAAIRIALVYSLSDGTMVTVNNVLPYAVIGGLVYWTITYSKRAGAKGAARLAAAQQAASAEAAQM
ncbi:VC0807 family protein [Kitasatospora sp. GP82]|uniref:VC0807 family protein n=1 Tax=Kitasatospora sp. GP82 TaxID=3035089 RepID=UPI0024771524|nr:VC0807 family protein [Kitasatospora sp. GP82]MDH6126510.1 intracellular septation protein A [Kitasatospora sp. GP82]